MINFRNMKESFTVDSNIEFTSISLAKDKENSHDTNVSQLTSICDSISQAG
jgi:hypothetical protein